MADLVEIGLPPSAVERITVHFGKALPSGAELEREPAVLFRPMAVDEGNESREAAVERQFGEEAAKWSMWPPISEPASELETAHSSKPEKSALDLCEGQALSAAGKEHVQTLLVAEKLEQYADAMVEQGYSFVDDLLEAGGEELSQLAKDVHMKAPEARRFLKAVAARKSAARAGGRPDGGAASCPICFELFGDGVVPRMLVGCGHSFCEVCLDKMLRPLPVRGGRKTLSCSTCRRECEVPRGRAAELPVNFLGLHR